MPFSLRKFKRVLKLQAFFFRSGVASYSQRLARRGDSSFTEPASSSQFYWGNFFLTFSSLTFAGSS